MTTAGWDLHAAVCHSPKPHGGKHAADVMDDRVRHLHPALLAEDFNRGQAEVARTFAGYRAHMCAVVGLLVDPHQLVLEKVRHFDVIPGSSDDDHPGTIGRVRPVDGDHPWLWVGFLNLIGAMDNTDRSPFSDRMLTVMRHEILELGGGLILAVEADDANVRKVLPPGEWQTEHRAGHDQDGVLMSITRSVGSITGARWHPGAPASPENAPRPILTGTVHVKAATERTHR